MSGAMIGLAAVLGAVAGSFAAVVALRLPRGEGVATGRSHCDACGSVLTAAEMVPILSYLGLRGRCRRCCARVDPLHVGMEAAGAAIGAAGAALLPPATALAGLILGLALAVLVVLDIRHFWLPDRITLPLAAAGLGFSVGGVGVPPVQAAIGAIAGFASLWLIAALYRGARGRDGLGGGDPKLFGAIGAWTGWMPLPFILVGACMLGLALVALDAARGRGVAPDTRVPLGALLAVAAWPIWLLVMAGAWPLAA